METKIRQLRKSRGWTLQKVADLVGTTAQTVQRLETANMTVSVDWLERFAQVFSVSPSSLIQDQPIRQIPVLGTMTNKGMTPDNTLTESIELSAVADQPIAIRLAHSLGCYSAGAFLICNRLEPEEMDRAHGLDALVSMDEQSVLLSKVIWQGATAIIAPLSRTLPIQTDVSPQWVAPIVMEIRYF